MDRRCDRGAGGRVAGSAWQSTQRLCGSASSCASSPDTRSSTPAWPSRLTRKSHTAVHNALNRLEHAGILQPLNKRWGRAWEAGELLELVADVERRVSSASGASE